MKNERLILDSLLERANHLFDKIQDTGIVPLDKEISDWQKSYKMLNGGHHERR